MKFWLMNFPHSTKRDVPKWVEANNPAHAAKLFAEKGITGVQTVVDEDGQPTKWDLHATTVYYAYPVLETG